MASCYEHSFGGSHEVLPISMLHTARRQKEGIAASSLPFLFQEYFSKKEKNINSY